MPQDLVITIQSNTERKLKSLSGAQIDRVELPKNLAYETFNFMINNMLNEHKKYNTDFYQEIVKDNRWLADFRSFSNKHKKHSISTATSFAKVGTLVSDYLINHNIRTSKRSIALILFEYFALFKAIPLKYSLEIPNDYGTLTSFYRDNNITSEKIRNMMKDVGEI